MRKIRNYIDKEDFSGNKLNEGKEKEMLQFQLQKHVLKNIDDKDKKLK
ncbi:24507_t:CDS:2, partial [Dentiscutata erythropus]